jgi:hypothetical protein
MESCNGTTPIEGLTLSNFLFLDSTGQPITTITLTEVGNGVYTITGYTGSATVQLNDSTFNTSIINYGGIYYQSNILPAVF